MSAAKPLHFVVVRLHDPDCPLGANGVRAYFEAREALASTPPEARATEADREALAIAEMELEQTQKCRCGLDPRDPSDPVELELKRQQQEAAAEWTQPRFEE